MRVDASGEPLGSVWALRSRDERQPDRAETRILSAAADQLGQAIVRDRVELERTGAEIARRSDALKTSLLDSVSHDLRTPLATIRAAAGSMLDQSISWTDDDRREAFEAIDSEAERMGRLVRNLLDLSRIEGGALKPELEPCDLDDIVAPVVRRARSATHKHIDMDLPDTLAPVLADQVFLSQVVANLLENAIRHGGDDIRVRAQPAAGWIEVVVEDNGRGVPDAALPRLFEKFYQVGPAGGEAPRHGHRNDGRGRAHTGDGRRSRGRPKPARGPASGREIDTRAGCPSQSRRPTSMKPRGGHDRARPAPCGGRGARPTLARRLPRTARVRSGSSRDGGATPYASGTRTGPIWSSWTSACPTGTASK